MKGKIKGDNNTQDIKFKPTGEDLNNEVIPIKMEMGNDIKVPFIKTSPHEIQNDDLCIPSSSKYTDNKKSFLLQPPEKKNCLLPKKEISSPMKENGDPLNISQNMKKTITLMRRLQSDLTPQAILPASRGKRVHVSLGGDAALSVKRIKLSQRSGSPRSCNSRTSDTLLLKQESPRDEFKIRANNSDSSLSPKQFNSASQANGNNISKMQLKSVKFKNEVSSNYKKHIGNAAKHLTNQTISDASKKTKTVSISSKSTSYNERSTTTCISSTVVTHSVTATKTKGQGRNREIDKLYSSLQETNWARDKEFTSLLYAKHSVRHSDRNSNIKAAITDRSKKLAKLGKTSKSPTKSFAKQLKPHAKLTKVIRPTLTVKSKPKLAVPIQKRIKKNVSPQPSVSRQHIKSPVKQKSPLSKRAELSKNVKTKAISQQLKMKFQRKKVPLSKSQDFRKKVKSKAMSHQLKMTQKKISAAKQNEISKKVNSKVTCQQIKMPQKSTVISKQNGAVKKEEKEIKVIYQKLKPSTTLKKKIPIQSVKPIVDYEKKSGLVNGVKAGNSKMPTATSNWKNICEIPMIPNLFADNRNPHVLSALQNNPELRVSVTPLETTHPWSSDFNFQSKLQREYDAHNRRLLQEKMHKVYASMDHSHISTVLQEVHDSIGIFPPSTRLPEEKTKKSVRSSVRQSECAFRYKEIVVKKHDNYLQVVLVPNIQKQNSLTVDAIKELREAFVAAKKDTNCNAVLLSSSGSFFCSGIDLGQLYGSNKKHIAEEMASALKDLILTLALFPKPVVAAVNGSAVGLGVSLLMYCDIILASDKATFCIPAAKMGYVPEGGVALTLPQVVGSSCAIEMLLHGRRLTAQQALKFGMVSEVLWPTQLMEEVIPRVRSLAEQPLQVMEITKTMVRCHLWEKLPAQLEHEWRLLPAQWLSSECQQNIKKLLQTGWLFEY